MQHGCGTIIYMSEYEPNETAQIFGANLRRMREWRGWSQSELARQMQEAGWPKYSQVAVSRTEEGSRVVRLDEAIAIARVMERRVDDLLDAGPVVEAWAQLRAKMDEHSGNVSRLRLAVHEFKESYLDLEVLSRGLEESIASEGGEVRVSETMERTLENARKILTVSAHDVLDQSLEYWEDANNVEHQEEA